MSDRVKSILSWIIPIAIGLIIAGIIRFFVYVPVTVSGDSMLNNLHDGQKVSAVKIATVHRGSVIAFDARKEDPGILPGSKYYIKRVIGLPGDTIESKDGVLLVNGKKVNESYLTATNKNAGTGNWTLETLSSGDSQFVTATSHWNDGKASKVPVNSYFVMGDNRAESEDSRYFGFVAKKHILGVTFVYPWNSDRSEVNLVWKHFFEN